MISISINDKLLRIYKFDDSIAVIQRYVTSLGKENIRDGPVTLPFYFKFNIEPTTFETNKSYSLIDIRDQLKNLTLEEVSHFEKQNEFYTDYPLINRKMLCMLWLTVHGYHKLEQYNFIKFFDETNIRNTLQNIYKRGFVNARLTYDDMQEFIKNSFEKWDKIHSLVQKKEKIYNILQQCKVPKLEKFNLEEIIEETVIHMPDGNNLIDIFDAFNVSVDIPYITLAHESERFIKVFSDILPPDEWIESEFPENVNAIYFYVLNNSLENTNFDKDYTCGVWTDKNIIRLTLRTDPSDPSSIIRNKIIQSLSNKIEYRVGSTNQKGISGKFSILDENFNRAVFTDMIFNDENVNHFIFVDENEKSSLHKPRFSFYYNHREQNNFSSSITITITPIFTESESKVEIRVSRASTRNQVDTFINVFQYIYALYLKRYEEIISEYKRLYDKVDFKKYIKDKPKEKFDKKTGERLAKLKKFNPDAFKEGYSNKCQPRYRQPYLVTDDVDELKTKFSKELGEEFEKDGLLQWPKGSKDVYACYPRELADDNDKYIWPGVIKQKENVNTYPEYSYLPCCFLNNQYTKFGSNLNKYLNLKDNKNEENEDDDNEEIDETNLDRPLGEKKLAPRGRFAELPNILEAVVQSCGYYNIDDKRKNFTPFVRHGVIRGPDSFVHALEKALNPLYTEVSIHDKKSMVRSTLQKIAKMDNFAIAKQELFDWDDESIRSHLIDPGSYIDPDLFLKMFENYYNCNIILFQVDKQTPGGDLVIPRHNIVHLHRKLDFDKNTVIIIKFSIHKIYKYQCEPVVKYTKSGELVYTFKNEKLITLLDTLISEINTVYLCMPEKGNYYKYTPI